MFRRERASPPLYWRWSEEVQVSSVRLNGKDPD